VGNLADIPEDNWQQFFNTAKTLAERGYELDLQHPNNILVDFEKQSFGFVDLQENSGKSHSTFSAQSIINSLLWNTGGSSWIGYSIQEESLKAELRTSMNTCIDKINKVLSDMGGGQSINKGIDVSTMTDEAKVAYAKKSRANLNSNRGEFLLGKPITDYFEYNYNVF
jgi:hypothetical protein